MKTVPTDSQATSNKALDILVMCEEDPPNGSKLIGANRTP